MITAKECILKYGIPFDNGVTPSVNESTLFEGRNMVLWDVPQDINNAIPALPNKIYCNKDMVPVIEKGLRNVIVRGLAGQIRTWDGCFNVRPMRGYEKQYAKAIKEGNVDLAITFLSMHSWGTAFDMNAAWNQLKQIPTMSKELVACFTDAGMDWGGSWKRLDGMHFQLAKI